MHNPWNVPSPGPAGTSPEPEPVPTSLPSSGPADGIALDRDWRICAIGPAAAAVFGYTPAELLGQHVHTLIPHGLAAQSEAAAPAGDCEEWVIGRSKDGRRFPLQFVAREPGAGAEREVALVLRRSSDLEAAPPIPPATDPRLNERERAHALRCQHEAEALRAAVTSVSQELAAARVIVTTLQHERDAWQAREAQARAQAESLAARLAQREADASEARTALAARDAESAQLRQRELELRQTLESLERRCDAQSRGLITAQRDAETVEAERRQLSTELLKQRQARTRAEQEVCALGATTADVSHELAAARVIVETLRQERDRWLTEASTAQAERAALQTRLTAAERLHREREEAERRVETLLRQALELAAPAPPSPAPLSNTPAATA
ncbi:MAG: PAS domain S-box protein [Verrucomicrobiales bacterium]|nr:PAS domain S-box protein [Verrucomicrobiales bacterium]